MLININSPSKSSEDASGALRGGTPIKGIPWGGSSRPFLGGPQHQAASQSWSHQGVFRVKRWWGQNSIIRGIPPWVWRGHPFRVLKSLGNISNMSQCPTPDPQGLIFSLKCIFWGSGILNQGHSVNHRGLSSTFSEQTFLNYFSLGIQLFHLPGVISEVSRSLIFGDIKPSKTFFKIIFPNQVFHFS